MTSIRMINVQHTNMETHTLRLVVWSPSRKEKKKKKPKWILQFCPTGFYSGLHMILECRGTKLWPVSGYIAESLVCTLKGRAGNKCPSQQTNRFCLTCQCLSFNNNNNSTTSTTTNVRVLVLVSSRFFRSYSEGAFTLGVRASPALLSMWRVEIFFTSKFSYVLFYNPTNNRWGTTNYKPPGPIIMIGQSETLSSSS